MQQKDVYVLRDLNDNEWEGHIDNDSFTKGWNRLLDTIMDSNIKCLVVDNECPVTISDKEVEVIRTYEDFFRFFDISIAEKEKDWNTYFKTYFEQENAWKEKAKPAIVGAAYKKNYKLGDCITSDEGECFIIKGFLKNNQAYALPTQSKDMVSLNREEQLNDGYFSSYRKQLVNVKKDTVEGILQYGTFGIILFVFSMLGLLGMMIQLLLECEKEYAIHLLCGAKITDILLRLLFQIGLLFLCGTIMCFIVFYNRQVRLAVSLLSFISFLLFFLYSTWRLHSESIMQKLRRNE